MQKYTINFKKQAFCKFNSLLPTKKHQIISSVLRICSLIVNSFTPDKCHSLFIYFAYPYGWGKFSKLPILFNFLYNKRTFVIIKTSLIIIYKKKIEY